VKKKGDARLMVCSLFTGSKHVLVRDDVSRARLFSVNREQSLKTLLSICAAVVERIYIPLATKEGGFGWISVLGRKTIVCRSSRTSVALNVPSSSDSTGLN